MKNIALIGFGNMGRKHVENLSALQRFFSIGAVYDIDPTARQAAWQAGFPVCEELSAILKNDEIEICLIAAPNEVHKELSIVCMEAGKHVICEKPATLNTDELIEVLTTAKIQNRIFTVDQNRRWDRDFIAVKKLFQNRPLGCPIYIDSRVQGSHGLPDNWLSRKGVGGMLLDWGVHLIDQLLDLLPGEVTQVYTQQVVLPGKECEENIKLLLRFSGGETAQIQADTRCYCRLPRWHIMFEQGTAVIGEIDGCGILYTPDGSSQVERENYSTGSGPSRTMAPSENIAEEPLVSGESPSYQDTFYQNVADAIDGTAELIVSPGQVLRVMKVLDAARLSAENSCSIHCHI